MTEQTIEYQLVLNVYVPSRGGSIKQVVRSSGRESAINKFKYLENLINRKNQSELQAWAQENLQFPGQIVSLDGLYGVSYIKIL